MEIKICKEIRNYTESIFFGLNLRQLAFSVFACLTALALYFILKPYLGLETLSWLCILAATPFGGVGFIRYHGMSAEKAIWAYIKSEFLMPKKLCFHGVNLYYELRARKITRKERKSYNDKDSKKHNEKG